MADKTTHSDPDKAEEARNLAKEAVEAMREGDKEEGDFLAHEAKALDPKAAKDVLDGETKGTKR